MVKQNKRIKILVVAGILLSTTVIPFIPQKTSAYSPNCKSLACHIAEDQAVAAQQKAAEASQKRDSVAGAIQSLDKALDAQQSKINAQQALANDLGTQVEETTVELNRDQEALAKLLVEMHFQKEPSAISILASSSTIGEASSTQARQESIRDKISDTAQQVANKKADLEQKKSDIDSILAELNTEKANLNQQRSERSATIAKYQSDINAAKAEASEASKKAAKEIAAEIAKNNSGGSIAPGGGGGIGVNSYPWRGQCPGVNATFQTNWGLVCQCTSYAGYKANEYWHSLPTAYWGNASNWANAARQRGYRVDGNPAPHTIAVSTAGIYGHVMWVEGVNGNGTINISEYNNYGSSLSHLPGDYGARTGVPAGAYQYIHFGE